MTKASVEALASARGFAELAHMGEVDRRGVDYIHHCLRVMDAVPPWAKRVAVLHDVVEDTECSMVDVLFVVDLTAAEIDALYLLTRPDPDDGARPDYSEYIQRIADGPGQAGRIARAVKRADLLDNLAPEREAPELSGLRRRYRRALEVLGGSQPGAISAASPKPSS